MDIGLLEAELEVGGIWASDMMTGEFKSSVTILSSDTGYEATSTMHDSIVQHQHQYSQHLIVV